MRMADYIKREAVLEWFRPYTHEDILLDPVDVIGKIRDIPSADVVEVVRCKDCIYYHKKLGIGFGKCSKCTLMPYPEDFCSYGERKPHD